MMENKTTRLKLGRLIFSNRGFSIVEMLVAVGILAVIMGSFATMMSNQSKELKAVDEKMFVKELETRLRNTLTSGAFCGCLMRNQAVTTGAPYNFTSTLPSVIPGGYSATPPAPAACTASPEILVPSAGPFAGSTIAPYSSPGTPRGITMSDVRLVSAGYYTANLNVALNPATLVRARKNITVGISFTTDASGNLTNCGASNMTVLKPATGYDNMTGTDACTSIGKSCQYVTSYNTIWEEAGCGSATHCMRVCLTWYNQPLPGVPPRYGGNWFDPGGSGQTNLFSCDAQVGAFTTYLDAPLLRCGGYFSAFCM